MSRGVNKAILIGNLGRDPEVRYMSGGKAVANLSLATSESWRDKNTGENKERTEWHSLVLYDRLAEIAGEYLKSGSKIYVEGKLQTRKWEDKNTGADRYTTEIVVRELQMLDSRGKGTGGGGYQQSQQAQRNNPRPPPDNQPMGDNGVGQQQQPMNDFDDDIPF